MSDLADLAADVAKDLPASIRKVINTAVENGWTLNKPGMTLCLRLNHLTDELAMPVYISWLVGRTPKGALSFRFDSCGTQGLNPLSGSDLLEYLADPTIVYPAPDEDQKATEAAEDSPPWNDQATPAQNLCASLGAEVIEDKPAPRPLGVSRASLPSSAASRPASNSAGSTAAGTQSSARSTVTARPLRVTTPQPRGSAATAAT